MIRSISCGVQAAPQYAIIRNNPRIHHQAILPFPPLPASLMMMMIDHVVPHHHRCHRLVSHHVHPSPPPSLPPQIPPQHRYFIYRHHRQQLAHSHQLSSSSTNSPRLCLPPPHVVFLVKCPSAFSRTSTQTSSPHGILLAMTNLFHHCGCEITAAQHFSQDASIYFRFCLHLNKPYDHRHRSLKHQFHNVVADFADLAKRLSLSWQAAPFSSSGSSAAASVSSSSFSFPPADNVAVLVSHEDDALHELLSLNRRGTLQCNISFVASNHKKLRPLADFFKVPFFHLLVEPGRNREQEIRLEALLSHFGVDLIVLARYMQVLSEKMCHSWPEKVINLHNSLLPAFPGARAYQQAWNAGVKFVGATAHYATASLDQGPIIGQEVVSVNGCRSKEAVACVGRQLERKVIAEAVKLHLERRIIVDGGKAIIFDA